MAPLRAALLAALVLPTSTYLLCSGRGMLATTNDDKCVCQHPWKGPDCTKRRCPTGRAWADYATATDAAHAHDVECSAMGHCDELTGLCACRAGWEGPACERLSCATHNGLECSGSGRCMSMRDAAAGWNGHSLVRPPTAYATPWDADMVRGCVCDVGFTGYDCSQRECPVGDDPVTAGGTNSVMRMACTADGGSVRFSFRGEAAVLPASAGFGTVAAKITALAGVHVAAVSFSSGATLCGASAEVVASVELTHDFGELPPARVEAVALTRTDAGTPAVALLTEQTVTCPTCGAGCGGAMYLSYDGALTAKLAWNANAAAVQTALEALVPLSAAALPPSGATVAVAQAGGALCLVGAPSTTVVTFRAEYGNLKTLGMVNSIATSTYDNNVTVVGAHSTKDGVECSNRGKCDASTGGCRCFAMETPLYRYRYESSDGYGQPGRRGDCGRKAIKPTSCPVAYAHDGVAMAQCNNRGLCLNATMTCQCEKGYSGGDCTVRECPKAPAWFDEASAVNVAHGEAECSNMGLCDRALGQCKCRPGFWGQACQRLACPGDATRGLGCSGHGTCEPMWRLAELAHVNGQAGAFTYGSAATAAAAPVWDRAAVHGCHCDSRDAHQPYNGPRALVSGVLADNPPVGGWSGYDCSRRTCPFGDDPRTAGVHEEQAVACTLATGNFTLSFRGATTGNIKHSATALQVEKALESLATLRDVKVTEAGAAGICDGAYSAPSQGFMVTFVTELGDVSALSSTPAFTVTEAAKGTMELAECSNRGYCDRETGHCQCMYGYGSSDGSGGVGVRRDCGVYDGTGLTLNHYLKPKGVE